MTSTLHITNELEQLTRLYAFLDRQADAYGLGKTLAMQVRLALEEAVTNVILYAYPGRRGEKIRIDMNCEEERLTVVVTDTGICFNPLERQDPDLALPTEERPIGGLGIYLVKQLMTEVSYCRSAGKNILTMTKVIH